MIESELHGDMQTATEMIAALRDCGVVTHQSEIPCRVVDFLSLPESLTILE
jgi:hypothetical protein